MKYTKHLHTEDVALYNSWEQTEDMFSCLDFDRVFVSEIVPKAQTTELQSLSRIDHTEVSTERRKENYPN